MDGGDVLVLDTHAPRILRLATIHDTLAMAAWEAPHSDTGLEQARRIRRSLDRQGLECMAVPDTLSAADKIFVDSERRIWVREDRIATREETNRWLIFGSDGRLRARLELPEAVVLADADASQVLAVERDELGVQRVKLYDIVPADPGSRTP